MNKKIIVMALVGITIITLVIVLIARKPWTESLGVQLWEGGPYWAECNVGATKPEKAGYYFWWGDTVGCKHSTEGYGWISVKDGTAYSFDDCPTRDKDNFQLQSERYIDSYGNLAAAHDAATAYLGAPWRMPTDKEFDELISNCDAEWTMRNGVYGRLVKGRGAYSSKSIFLPAVVAAGMHGLYWASTSNSDNYYFKTSWILYFDSSDFSRKDMYRNIGLSVRPVRGSIK